MTETFARKLSRLRSITGYSLQELANKVSVTKQAVHKYENAQMMPDSTVLSKLADVFSVSVDYFFDPEVSVPVKLAGNVRFREGDKNTHFDEEKVKKETEVFISRVDEFEKLTNNKIEFKNPIEDRPIKNVKHATDAAKILRKKWKLGNAPIYNIVSFLESKGVKVYEVNDFEYFEGFSVWSGKIPIIVINGGKNELTRIRFTTLHELGHLVLQIDEDGFTEELIEKFCDAFASEMLLPSEMIIVELGNNRTKISIDELKNIKMKYGISISAIMVRAVSTGIITRDIYNSWKRNYSYWNETNQDFGKYYGSEEPTRLKQLIHNCVVENKITINKVASIFGIKEGILKKKLAITESFYNTSNQLTHGINY